ncbi:hypothetical protein [Roseimaritima multifibrata]|uniref:hypothetical protein n=1 Tax=Roseimaritima multifibrata TaxID=1930274 RepID=UPI001C54F604|nr:hypothetical protein [Roseimaritima multifibrata]
MTLIAAQHLGKRATIHIEWDGTGDRIGQWCADSSTSTGLHPEYEYDIFDTKTIAITG